MAAATVVRGSRSTLGNKRVEILTVTAASGDTLTSEMARPEAIFGPALTSAALSGQTYTLTLSASVTAQQFMIIGT